jgi:hypothetical protein
MNIPNGDSFVEEIRLAYGDAAANKFQKGITRKMQPQELDELLRSILHDLNPSLTANIEKLREARCESRASGLDLESVDTTSQKARIARIAANFDRIFEEKAQGQGKG